MIETLRSFDSKMVVDDVDKDERCITFRVNTDDIDDHRTVILPSGGKFERFRALGSPVLWDHGLDVRRGKDPIAKCLMIRSYGKKRPEIRARDQFFEDDFSQQRYEWYRDEKLTGVSIRFMQPNEGDYGPPTADEIRDRPELEQLRTVWRETQGKRGWVLRSWDMAEHSCTPMPSNPNTISVGRSAALLECCRSGMWLPDDVKAQLEARAAEQVEVPPVVEPPAQEKPEPIEGPRVVRDGDTYRVMIGERCLRSLSDDALARAYLAALSDETDPKKSPEYLAFLSRSRHEAFQERMTHLINEYVEFRCYGALGSQ
jgi:hypothetical protein